MDEQAFYVGLGKAIVSRRKRIKISQEHLADKADINRSHMGKIERGEVAPKTDTLWRLCEVFGIPLSRLIRQGEKLGSPKK